MGENIDHGSAPSPAVAIAHDAHFMAQLAPGTTLATQDHAIALTSAPRSGKWPAVEKSHLLKQPTCQACGGVKQLAVHHRQPFHLFPTLELDPTNLITLCEAGPGLNCHLALGHIGQWPAWNPNVVADAALHLETVGHKKLGK